MADQPKIVFKRTDVPYLQSPDNTMRDQVMVTEDTCGSQQYTAVLLVAQARDRRSRGPPRGSGRDLLRL